MCRLAHNGDLLLLSGTEILHTKAPCPEGGKGADNNFEWCFLDEAGIGLNGLYAAHIGH